MNALMIPINNRQMGLNQVSLFVSVLLIGAMLQQTSCQDIATATCALTTTNGNSFALNWLKSKGVTILDAPKRDVSANLCGGSWTKDGTCCDLASLTSFIKTSNDASVSRWGKYVSKIARIRGKLLGPFRKIMKALNKASLDKKINMMKANKKIGSGFSKVYSMLPATDEQLTSLKTSVEKFEDSLKVYKQKGKICFDAMKVARANLMCGACSAVGSTLSTVQSSTQAVFKITTDDCSALVAKCFPVWKFNFDLSTMMEFFSLLRAPGKSGEKVDTKFTSQLDVSDADLVTIKGDFATCSIKDGETIITCTKTASSTLTASEISSRLCTKLFSANKGNSFIEGDESVDADIEDKDIEEADSTATSTAAESSGTSAPAVNSRILQTAETTIGVTTSDSGAIANLNAANSVLVPEASATTSTAGDGSPGLSGIVATAASLAVIAISTLF